MPLGLVLGWRDIAQGRMHADVAYRPHPGSVRCAAEHLPEHDTPANTLLPRFRVRIKRSTEAFSVGLPTAAMLIWTWATSSRFRESPSSVQE